MEALAGRGWKVISTGRSLNGQSERATERWILDVTQPQSVRACVDRALNALGHLDVVINNAGVLLENQRGYEESEASLGSERGPFGVSIEMVRKTFEVNTLGPYALCQAVLPSMMDRKSGRIVNVSSLLGSLTHMDDQYPAYRISKTALHAVTRIFAAAVETLPDVRVNAVWPGWVKTDMGGPQAPRPLDEGVRSILWAVDVPAGGPNGGIFQDGERMDP